MNVLYYLDGAKRYFTKYEEVNFINVKKFLIDENKISFCSVCEPKLVDLMNGVCRKCKAHKMQLIKFFVLLKDIHNDVEHFMHLEKQIKENNLC